MNSLHHAFGAFLVLLLVVPAWGQQNFENTQMEIVDVSDDIYMLVGRGGNIGVSVGEDGVFLVDDQFAPLTGKILAAIATLTDKPVRFVLNTHFHGDHVGGNENLGKAGAIIVAHENVRVRMSTEQFRASVGRATPPAPSGALPVVTFTEGLSFHWNGDHIRVFHDWTQGRAHTDGDAIVQFTNAQVFHMGDVYFNGMYPFVDVESGGNVQGVINAAQHVLRSSDENTKIIPGHGPLSDREELQVYTDMLIAVTDAVREGMLEGLTLEEIVALEPTRNYDADWGGGFISPEAFVGAVYRSLQDN